MWSADGNNLGIGIFLQLPTSIGDWKLKDEKYLYVHAAGGRKREPSNELRPTTTSNWSPLHQWAMGMLKLRILAFDSPPG